MASDYFRDNRSQLDYMDVGLKTKSKGFEKFDHKLQPMLYFMKTGIQK